MYDMRSQGQAASSARYVPFPEAGLAAGTIVFTLDGALPVEFLNPGDRIITHSGARRLKDVDVSMDGGFVLIFDRPEVIYADGEEVLAG